MGFYYDAMACEVYPFKSQRSRKYYEVYGVSEIVFALIPETLIPHKQGGFRM